MQVLLNSKNSNKTKNQPTHLSLKNFSPIIMHPRYTLLTIPVGLSFALLIFPMLMLDHDMWDGTIMEYASEIRDFSGLKTFSTESTWFLQYWLSLAVIEMAALIEISYKNLNALVVSLLMFSIIREAFLISTLRLRLGKRSTLLSCCLVATFPAWVDLLSSVLTVHLFCICIGLFAIRKIHAGRQIARVSSYLLLVPAFNFPSLLMFLPFLSYLYDITDESKYRQSNRFQSSLKTGVVLTIGLGFYAVVRTVFKPHGLYEGYNNIVLTNADGLFRATVAGLYFGTYFAPLLLVCGLILVTGLLIPREKEVCVVNQERNISDSMAVIGLCLLSCAAIFPYIAVGKGSLLWGVSDWESRQAFPLAVPIALLTTVILKTIYDRANFNLVKKMVVIFGFALVFLNISILTWGVLTKMNRQLFEIELQRIIKINSHQILPGLVEIVGRDIPPPILRSYESNFLMFKSTGKADWWTSVYETRIHNVKLPEFLLNNTVYQKIYIYNHKSDYVSNHTVVNIEVTNFRGPSNVIQNVFDNGGKSGVKLISIEQAVGPIKPL